MRIEDLYSYVLRRNQSENNFKHSVLNMYTMNVKYSHFFIRLILWPFFFILRPKNKKKYFFYGIKFKDIIKSLPSDQVCIIGGPKQIKFALANNISVISCMYFWRSILQEGQSKPSNIKLCIDKLHNKLDNIKTNDAVVVVDNDSLPMQRACIMSARLSNIKTICIQDGLFQSKSPSHVVHGWYADEFICFDHFQKEILVKKGIEANKIVIGGFYAQPLGQKKQLPEPMSRKICFLGQPWFKYGEEFSEVYLNNIRTLKFSLEELGYDFHYKPHPWENGATYLTSFDGLFRGNLGECFNEYDVFFSYTSTALFEAEYSGRISIQILDGLFQGDNFSTYGYARSIESVDLADLDKLRNLISSKPSSISNYSFDLEVIK